MSLYDYLKNYSGQDLLPMHMPGHKRAVLENAQGLPYAIDVTEVEGTDDLHDASGVLKECADRARTLWHAQNANMLVNGSTCGILAAVSAAVPEGASILMARGCHKSVYHAVMLRKLVPVYIQPDIDPETGITQAIDVQQIQMILEKHPEIKAVVLTSPTYEGVISPIDEIANVVHAHGGILIVDSAHGAHIPFETPEYEIHEADIVIVSLHKTLPALTQTALLLQYSNRINRDKIRFWLSVYETSSPSYPLMASMDACFEWLASDGKQAFDTYGKDKNEFYKETAQLKHLKVLSADKHDSGKVVILTHRTNMTGPELAKVLRERYQIETEMSSSRYVLAMTSVMDTRHSFERLWSALQDLDLTLEGRHPEHLEIHRLPQTYTIPGNTLTASTRDCSIKEAQGQVCGEFVWAYPPEIPILVPGEIVPEQFQEMILGAIQQGIHMQSTSGLLPTGMRIVDVSI